MCDVINPCFRSRDTDHDSHQLSDEASMLTVYLKQVCGITEKQCITASREGNVSIHKE